MNRQVRIGRKGVAASFAGFIAWWHIYLMYFIYSYGFLNHKLTQSINVLI
jgi:hypothetical protein